MSRLCLYYIRESEQNRWLPGDRYVRPIVRRIIRGAPRPGGVDKVFINLCLGLDKLGIPYEVNLPFPKLQQHDRVGILGRGLSCLNGYNQRNPIVAGIGLMTHPSEWPNLCEQYPVVRYLQHSHWANEVYKPYFGHRCTIWPVGIDTETWCSTHSESKSIDFLIYNKIMWNYDQRNLDLLEPICRILTQKKLSFEQLRYGFYHPQDYRQALKRCRAMIFLCEHESQGLAYQECLSSDIPILAWDRGECLDPNRFKWGMPHIPATSVPYWDERCGVKFKDIHEFPIRLGEFLEKLNSQQFSPRNYILENLTLEKCARHYLEILNQVQKSIT
ncbi:glycosyltransferase family 1 protein [Scytonema sp. UIC 10036]|uniref:glycosyltransferase n=1 Tax=Scytonema sp. UIC 10036 TaxID=2304196 RepID=UPI0012DA7AD1|nr:glycosyltransferase [Scytonema sp. UIC 10036]MUG94046.1 glycosyltransferase family 1 protein [Scytonema sp. UIC 10036]